MPRSRDAEKADAYPSALHTKNAHEGLSAIHGQADTATASAVASGGRLRRPPVLRFVCVAAASSSRDLIHFHNFG